MSDKFTDIYAVVAVAFLADNSRKPHRTRPAAKPEKLD